MYKRQAPACMDDLKAAGIENFIHVRVNVLDTLKEFNAKLLKYMCWVMKNVTGAMLKI